MTLDRKLHISRGLRLIALSLAVAALAPGQPHAATLASLVIFNGTDGNSPFAGLIVDSDGNLFGTTHSGGTNNGGTVFEIAKTASGYASVPTILYSFCSVTMNGVCTDGSGPVAGLIIDASGNLLGTTQAGGANDGGTVFEIAKTASGYASTPTILYSFCTQANCADGSMPLAGLIADANGNLFGTTLLGGANGAGGLVLPTAFGGTVFEVAKTAGGYASTPTILYSFCAQANCADGSQPFGGLITDANGNLFGTTSTGGANGGGTVFEIAKTASGYASVPAILYSFCSQTNCTDGESPEAGLIADAHGNLFGTTERGGANGGGTVFEIAKTASGYASTPTILYSFCSQTFCADGSGPVASLIADANGNLFGTTVVGGTNGFGTVFEIAKTASGYATTPAFLYSFCSQTNCADGIEPVASLIADASGNLFGTTSDLGGTNSAGLGTVFELTGSGFVGPFAGTPGNANCHGKTVSALAQKYGGLNAAAAALGYSSVADLQNAIASYCAG